MTGNGELDLSGLWLE